MEPRGEPSVQPSPTPSYRGSRTGALLLVVGGGLLIAASWVDLGTASGAGYREVIRAPDSFEGGAFVAAGLAFVVAGMVVWGPRVDRHSRIAGLGSALGAGGVLWLAVAAALAVGREGGRLGDGVDVALGPGVYLAVAGAGLALIGGGFALFGPRERARRTASGFGAPEPRERRRPPPVPEEPSAWRSEPPAPRQAPVWSEGPPTSGEPGEADEAERRGSEEPGDGLGPGP